MLKLRSLLFLFATLSILMPQEAWARMSQLTIRGGPVYGNYDGPMEGHFTVPNGIDVQYGIFVESNKTLNFRATLALKLPESKAFYIYAGTGMSFYGDSKGMAVDQSEGGFTIHSVATRRYYWGFDVGLSQAIVESFGAVLQAVSTMIDTGVHGGVIFQMNEKFGIDVNGGASGGFGISSVGVTGITLRGMVGVTYSF